MGAQRRVLQAAAHAVPGGHEERPPRRLRPAAAAGELHAPGVRRVRSAAEPERDDQRRAIPAAVRLRRRRGAAERQHAGGQQVRDAPVAPAWA